MWRGVSVLRREVERVNVRDPIFVQQRGNGYCSLPSVHISTSLCSILAFGVAPGRKGRAGFARGAALEGEKGMEEAEFSQFLGSPAQ